MKKIIFYSLPGHGHTNPILNVAKELTRLGNTVIFYSAEEFRQKIEQTGAIYRAYDTTHFFDPRTSGNVSLFIEKLVNATTQGIKTLLEENNQEKPDCIVHDTLALWGKIISDVTHIPAVSVFTSFAFNNKTTKKYPTIYIPMIIRALPKGNHLLRGLIEYKKLNEKYKLKINLNEIPLTKEKLNIIFTSSYLQPCSESFDNTFKFVGPSIYPQDKTNDLFKKIPQNKKLIYISMGTIFNDNLNFYHLCINTFKNTPYQVILSLGQRFETKDLPNIPENIIIKNQVPQLEVLQKADLFITHAGMNSINESLYYGVPMIAIPQIYEQKVNATRIDELGAGIYLKTQKVTKQSLLKTTQKILQSKKYYTNAAKIQKTLHNTGGYQKAAQEILNYLHEQHI